ncbi:MAG: serine hydrolase [Anaerolineales bacterium]
MPVAGLTRKEAAQQLLEAYSQPVELRYDEAIIHLEPSTVGFELDLESMLAAADLERTNQPFWLGFWDYLWGRERSKSAIPLRADYSEERLRTYLKDEISARYDKPPTAAKPQTGTVKFISGQEGTELDIDQAVTAIENALFSVNNRRVNLPKSRTNPPRPSLKNLETLLKQTIDIDGFDGIVGLYMFHLDATEEIHFAYQNGQEIPTNPDVAFTAGSIAKIPIMVSIFRRIEIDEDTEVLNLLQKMIIQSGNADADWVMERVIDSNLAPLEITEDMRKLGLENTFLAGEFGLGSPLLQRFQTPANQRDDVNTDPDPYNQTTPSDMGMLLEDIYQCSETGGGALKAIFPDQFTQEECQTMINYLSQNKIAHLIAGGVPDTTEIAHKHSWTTFNGIMYTLGDAGIVYSPAGEYILVIFLDHPVQIIWENASLLVGKLSEAIYNFYNLPAQ